MHDQLGHNIDAAALQHSLRMTKLYFSFSSWREGKRPRLLFSALMKSDCIFPFFQLPIFWFSASSKARVTGEPQIKWTVAHFPQEAGNDISLRQSSADSEKFPIRLLIAFKWIWENWIHAWLYCLTIIFFNETLSDNAFEQFDDFTALHRSEWGGVGGGLWALSRPCRARHRGPIRRQSSLNPAVSHQQLTR